jgi:hypothetical protein
MVKMMDKSGFVWVVKMMDKQGKKSGDVWVVRNNNTKTTL